MLAAKLEAQRVLEDLPDDASLEDIQYRLYVLQKIDHARQAVARGEVVSHEEVMRQMAPWLER